MFKCVWLKLQRAGHGAFLGEGASNNVHGQVYVHREGLPLSLLRDGLEKLRYEEFLKALQG